MENNTLDINKMLKDYLNGNLSKEEVKELKQYLRANGELDMFYAMRTAQLEWSEKFEPEAAIPTSGRINEFKIDPMRLAAANKEGFLCDIECEEYVLLSLGYDVNKKTLLDDAYKNKWMKEKGMPFYNIGRLLSKYMLSVVRRYSNIDDAINMLARNDMLIAVVNSAKLSENECVVNNVSQNTPDHAVVIIEISKDSGTVTLFDPQTGSSTDVYSLSSFEKAWNDSNNYMVVTNTQDKFVYEPQPINAEDEVLDADIIELGEAIAENAHEVWAKQRHDQGWTYGPKRNDDRKETPDMRPYSDLEETEKEYDRIMAMQTLKLVQKMGFRIVKEG